MAKFQDKVVLVTGGTAGIGLACAELFAREGAHVLMVGRDITTGEKVKQDFLKTYGRGNFFRADLAIRGEIQNLFKYIVSHYGHLDFAVNNAGMDGASFTRLLEYPEETWDSVLNLNLTSVWLCMKQELTLMLSRSNCAIVNIASVAGLKASYSGGCAYTASKHGLVGLTKSAAIEYAQDGVRINAICPAIIKTPLAEKVLGDKISEVDAMHPLGRIGTPTEVAQAVLWLCSTESSFITGIALPVDGGIMAK